MSSFYKVFFVFVSSLKLFCCPCYLSIYSIWLVSFSPMNVIILHSVLDVWDYIVQNPTSLQQHFIRKLKASMEQYALTVSHLSCKKYLYLWSSYLSNLSCIDILKYIPPSNISVMQCHILLHFTISVNIQGKLQYFEKWMNARFCQ